MRSSARLTAALVIVASFAGLPAIAKATVAGKNGRIAFVRQTPSNSPLYERDIWTMNPDGSDQRQLTTAAEWDILPDWSPDASKIAFVSLREAGFNIWVMNADGTGQRRLTQDAVFNYSPSWSAAGDQIAYTRDRWVGANRYSDLLVMNADGSGQHRIVGGDKEFVWEPSWSPDGSRIAYSEWHDAPYGHMIWTVRPDGTDRRLAASITYRNLRAPEWSPDSTKLVFAAQRDYYYFDLWVANADRSGDPSLLARDADMPSWSPDGTKIAFSRWNYPPGQQAWVMNADGSGQQPIAVTGDASYLSRPDWATVPAPRRSDYKNAAQFCKALRAFSEDQFASRYGSEANAFGKCVRSSN
jgi:Tol biopolymer transport system component